MDEAYERIQRYFPDSPVFLDVFADPEADNDQELVASVSTALSSADAHERLARLDDDWWLSALHRAKGKLCIKLEFR